MAEVLAWLPKHQGWIDGLETAKKCEPAEAIERMTRLANFSLDFLQTAKLDKLAARSVAAEPEHRFRTQTVRLALLGSSTLKHLVPGIRVAALRRGFWIEVFEGDYGMYHQDLADPESALRAFRPDFVLLALDAQHLFSGRRDVRSCLELLTSCWQLIKGMGATAIQQTILATEPSVLGNNEHRLASSSAARIAALNGALRAEAAASGGVELLALDTLVQDQGMTTWHDRSLWHHAKQEVHPRMAPEYGDQVARIVASLRGLSSKCLVLDLDNTLWGGVIGDDGINQIVLGQGSGAGEAYASFQRYVKSLAERGCTLAICSKNDDSVAREPFERHPEMVLRLEDIACFVANWQDKATNLRQIAERLNIGLDSLVFVDDNPFERELVRRELPMVAVPELPDDPALYTSCLANAGYFEATAITAEDRERNDLYRRAAQSETLRSEFTDLPGYLRALEMKLVWAPLAPIALSRVTQLINKTNQFNLTTRRRREAEVAALLDDPSWLCMHFRLTDRFGDHGLIAVVIGSLRDRAFELDTWLMSCRVLGRDVEEATLSVVAAQARLLGAERLVGRYIPSAKNGMVKDHYRKLGFDELDTNDSGESSWELPLERELATHHFITIASTENTCSVNKSTKDSTTYSETSWTTPP